MRPITIHGLRIPQRDDVRSLIRPKNGLPTMVEPSSVAALMTPRATAHPEA